MFQVTPSEYMLMPNFSVWILQHTSASKRRIVLTVSLGVFPEKGVEHLELLFVQYFRV